jgi:V8-like Glu-specific endopeptidase
MNKNFFLFLVLLIYTVNSNAGIVAKVVYGDDNRMDMFENQNSMFHNLALSTAAMIPTNSLNDDGTLTQIRGGTLEGDGICSDEKFAKQPTAAMCSGFLVGKDLLVTAGHCITSDADCSSNSWVFDYALNLASDSGTTVKNTSVYKCSKIISRTQDRSTQNDFALIKLDRVVSDRSPLNFRKSGKIKNKADLVVIGHPSGLPTKISNDAFVRTNDNKYFFQANLDTFGGNSGSAVFDSTTGVVEGILVRGETDYSYDSASACYRTKKCTMDNCRGEDVTRITNVTGL